MQHKESKNPEPLAVSAQDVGGILRNQGISEERVAVFQKKCEEQFHDSTVLTPANLIDSKRFEVKTEQVTLSVDPAYSHLVETRVIDGKRYLLIPAEAGVEINGMAVEM